MFVILTLNLMTIGHLSLTQVYRRLLTWRLQLLLKHVANYLCKVTSVFELCLMETFR